VIDLTAVFFDLDDTLYDQLQPFQSAFNSLFSHITDVTILDLYKKSREYSDRVFPLTESGKMTVEEMNKNRVIYAFDHFHYQISEEEAMHFQEIYKEHQYKISLVPEMENILNYLSSKNVPLYILTNGHSNHQRLKLEALNPFQWIPQNNIFVSSEVGYSKPQKEIFEYVNAQTNTTASESFIIGDSFENDIMGAHNAKWNSIWLNTKQRKMPSNERHPNYEATSYRELEQLIKNTF